MSTIDIDDLHAPDIVILEAKINRYPATTRGTDSSGKKLPADWNHWISHFQLEAIYRLFSVPPELLKDYEPEDSDLDL